MYLRTGKILNSNTGYMENRSYHSLLLRLQLQLLFAESRSEDLVRNVMVHSDHDPGLLPISNSNCQKIIKIHWSLSNIKYFSQSCLPLSLLESLDVLCMLFLGWDPSLIQLTMSVVVDKYSALYGDCCILLNFLKLVCENWRHLEVFQIGQ